MVEGNRHQRLAVAALTDYLGRQEQLRDRIVRPQWLTKWLYHLAKLLLILSEIGAGTAALYVAGDPVTLAIITFTGVAVTTVAAGSHIGIQVRRGELGNAKSLVATAVVAVAFATMMLFATRYLTVGAVSAVLAFVTAMVALGSAFLGYQWHDEIADQLTRAEQEYRKLQKTADRHFDHASVRRFEQAEAVLRPGLFDALQTAHQRSSAPRSALSEAAGIATPPVGATATPDRAMVDDLLESLVGPEVLTLTPKVDK